MNEIRDILRSMDYGPAPESADIVRSWLEKNAGGFDHFIGGRRSPPAEGARFEVANPANGKKLADVAQGSAADVDRAVKAAKKAFRSWSALPGHGRARYLYAIARHIQKRERFLAVL